MRLKYLGKTSDHFSCAGQNLKAGDVGSFAEDIGQSLLDNFPQDLQRVDEPAEKNHAPKENKMAKKTAQFKSK